MLQILNSQGSRTSIERQFFAAIQPLLHFGWRDFQIVHSADCSMVYLDEKLSAALRIPALKRRPKQNRTIYQKNAHLSSRLPFAF